MFFDCKLFAWNFHFKRLLLLTQSFIVLMVIFQPRGKFTGFRGITKRLLSHVYKRQNPGFVSGAYCLIAYAYFVPTI